MAHLDWGWAAKVAGPLAKSTLALACVVFVMGPGLARAHETQPAVADVAVSETFVTMTVILNGEAMVAGIDLSSITDTNDAPNADDYDALRAMEPDAFEEAFRAYWPHFAEGLILSAGETALAPTLDGVETEAAASASLPRQSRVSLSAPLPDDDTNVTIGWASSYGPMIVRQSVDDLPEGDVAYSAFLGPGQRSAPLPRTGTATLGGLESFGNYIGLGFTHIVPKGLDHILFVLGLFFFSMKLRPLLSQVTAFTVAHTLTLALATLGVVSVPASIVEPLIALSIAYVAFENILRPRLTRIRLVVVFGFGLLHGLGFASVLGEIGLSPGHFIASLIAFNLGVELGQLAILLTAFLSIGIWFGSKSWYRARVIVPASLAIGAMGLWWAAERVIL